MTSSLRRADAPPPTEAAGRQVNSRAARPVDRDVSVREFLTAGGLRGFTTADMFPVVAS